MRKILVLTLIVISFNAISNEQTQLNESENSDLFYNYVGFGMGVGMQIDSNLIDTAFGMDFRAGYSINSNLYTKFNMVNSAAGNYFIGDIGTKSTSNFQFGIRDSQQSLDAYAAVELEFNKIEVPNADDPSWINAGVNAGVRAKLNLFNALDGSVSGALHLGTTSINQEFSLYKGFAIDAELMLFKTLSVYYELSSKTFKQVGGDIEFPFDGIIGQSALGLKFNY